MMDLIRRQQRPPRQNILYGYIPQQNTPIIIAAIFAAIFVVLFLQTWRSKSRAWKYFWPFLLAVGGESVGYGFRKLSISTKYIHTLWPYLVSQLFLILAPVAMAATLYIVFGRIITQVGRRYTPIKPTRVTKTFISFDILSFIVQGAGGSLYASNSASIFKVAKVVLVIGFLIQIVAFGIFLSFAIVYHIRARKGGISAGPWSTLLYSMYFISFCILVRSIFRTIEFASGSGTQNGYLLTHESFFYGLEAGPILAASIAGIIWHPCRFLPLSQPDFELGKLDEEDQSSAATSTAKPRRFWQRRSRSRNAVDVEPQMSQVL